MSELLVAIGAARQLSADLHLDLGELHPTQQGGMQLALAVEKDVISGADPRIGFVHRSAEKLFEARDYRQLMMLANRHDWVSAFSSELAIALVLEDAMGIITPERATWTRMMLAEMNRLTAILLMLGSASARHRELLAMRESHLGLLEQLTGSRIHPMFNRIGGIARVPEPPWLTELLTLVTAQQRALVELPEAVTESFEQCIGFGVITPAQVNAFGLSGTIAHASGSSLDLRVAEPYLSYAAVMTAADLPSAGAGDIPSRFASMAVQAQVSMRVIASSSQWLLDSGPGPFDVQLPKVVRAPELTSYSSIEGSLGITGVLLDSVGDSRPWRLKLRTPAFATIQSLTATLIGLPLELLKPMVQSCAFVIGDADR